MAGPSTSPTGAEHPETMSLADLLAAIALREADLRGAEMAVDELHRRWGRRILGIARMARFTFPGNQLGHDDFAQRIWEHLLAKATQFDGGGRSGPDLERRFLAWLMTMVAHLHTDIVRSLGQPLSELADDQDVAGPEHRDPYGVFATPRPGSPEAARDEQMLAGLRPGLADAIRCLRALRHDWQEVLRRSSPFFTLDGGGVDIPPDLLHAMLADLKTTTDGFKAQRSRALKDVRACVAKRAAARRSQEARDA